jgi:hypothetical protein
MAELSRGCPVSEGINYVIVCSSKHFNIRIGCIGVQFLAHLSLAQLSFSDRKVFRRPPVRRLYFQMNKER